MAKDMAAIKKHNKDRMRTRKRRKFIEKHGYLAYYLKYLLHRDDWRKQSIFWQGR
jgi:hypothetical protein